MSERRKNLMSRLMARITPAQKQFVRKNLDISEQIMSILDQRGMKQKEFAGLLDKKESEISRWLTGKHNLTLRTITTMEAVLETDIIMTPLKAEEKFWTHIASSIQPFSVEIANFSDGCKVNLSEYTASIIGNHYPPGGEFLILAEATAPSEVVETPCDEIEEDLPLAA
jgi:transcriptional regulator with XRE-family HTH domain